MEESWVLPVPTGERTSEAMVAASVEPFVIILLEFIIIVTGPPRLLPP